MTQDVSREVQLRAQLRDAIQTLSNARRSEVWEIVNELLRVGGSVGSGDQT